MDGAIAYTVHAREGRLGTRVVNDYRRRRRHATAPLSQGSQKTKSADTLHIRGRP